jgi:prophage antirepressor-like protein
MNTITPFLFEGNTVRTAIVNDAIYFCARDLTRLLEYNDHKEALRDNCDAGIISEEERGATTVTPLCISLEIETAGGKQKAKFINEDNMWSLVLGSRLEKAKQIRKWITSEVLPSIRKTGSYTLPQVEKKEKAIKQPKPRSAAMAKVLLEFIKEQKQELIELGVNRVLVNTVVYNTALKENLMDCTEFKDALPPLNANRLITPTEIGKQINNMSARQINDLLIKMSFQRLVVEGDKKYYEVVGEGKAYNVVTLQATNKWSGTQLKWKDTIIPIIKEYIIFIQNNLLTQE